MPHTPAPWTIQEYGDDECPTLVLHRGETENRICFMATPGSRGDPAMIEADAHLIAAAPDLLAQLKLMVELFDGYQGMELQWAKQAIAKAEGAELAL